MKAVAIVAHPDDEVIWCGGLILRKPLWEWTVLCLSRADDAERAGRFRRVCGRLGVRGIISDLDDSAPPRPIDTAAEIGGRIVEHLAACRWDLALTHGPDGEYGHRRHRQTCAETTRLAASGDLRCARLWTFAYACDPVAGRCEGRPDADIRVKLTAAMLNEKTRIIRDLYGFAPDSFEVAACISPESFRRAWACGIGEDR